MLTIVDNEALLLVREALKSVNQHDLPGDNVTRQERVTGNSKAYTLSRLERESPELFQQVCEGGSISQCIAVQEARENPAMGWGGDRSKDTDKQPDNVRLRDYGTSTDYTLRRLARDGHDELLDQIEAGVALTMSKLLRAATEG